MIVITNQALCKDDFLSRIEKIAMAKPDKIILREKSLTVEKYEKLAQACFTICQKNNVCLLVHTYLQTAKKWNISAVHLPYSLFLNQSSHRNHWQECGVSVHSLEEAMIAEKLGATYLIAGHIFETNCKKGLKPRGLLFLEEICQKVKIPVYGIGGIKKENVKTVLSTGAQGICIMSEMMQCLNPHEKIIEYQKIEKAYMIL